MILFILFVIALARVITSVFLTFVTDALIELNFEKFIFWEVAYLCVWALIIMMMYFSNIYKASLIERMIVDLKKNLLQSIIYNDYEEIKDYQKSKYISMLLNDTNIIQENAFANFYNLSYSIFQVSLSIIALFSYNTVFPIIVLLLSLLMYYIPKEKIKRVEKSMIEYSNITEKQTNKFSDLVSGFHVFQKLAIPQLFMKETEQLLKEVKNKKVSLEKSRSFVEVISDSFQIFSVLLIDVLTGLLVFRGLVTVGSIATTGSLANNIFYLHSDIISYISDIKSTRPIFDKFSEFNTGIILPSTQATPSNMKFGRIDLKHVSFEYYDKKKIISNLNYTFLKGSKYVLKGDSGKGKSTLLKLISGLLTPTKGVVTIDGGLDLNSLPKQLFYSNILYYEQTPFIFNESVLYNITLGNNYSEEELNKVIEISGLHTYTQKDHDWLYKNCGDGGDFLSGGQKQRVVLARYLLKKPHFILFDEGTSNLDRTSAEEIEKMLFSLTDIGVIIVSHNISREIEEKSDDIIML